MHFICGGGAIVATHSVVTYSVQSANPQ